MAVVVITNPETSVPSLEEVKAHLRATDFTDDDEDIQSKIWGAITEFEDPNLGFLGRSINERELEVSFETFSECLHLPCFPILTGEDYPFTVKYDDSEGNEQILDDAIYRILDAENSKCRIVLKSGKSWPTTIDQEQAVRVRYWAGYPADDPRISNFKSAVKLHVQMTYDVNKDEAGSLSATIYRLLQPYRVMNV